MDKIPRDEWIAILSNYCHGERSGSELISRLLDFAPGKDEKMWVRQWAAEEMEHHKLWDSLMAGRKMQEKEMTEGLKNIYSITDGFVSRKDWVGSMVSAAIIEHMSNAAAAYLFRHADPETRQVFRRITGDDLAHLDFDIAQLEKAAESRDGRRRIMTAHKAFLREIMQWPFRSGVTDNELRILNETYQLHRFRMGRIGIRLPDIAFSRSLSFRVQKAFLEMVLRF